METGSDKWGEGSARFLLPDRLFSDLSLGKLSPSAPSEFALLSLTPPARRGAQESSLALLIAPGIAKSLLCVERVAASP